MKGQQVKTIRKRLGLSQREFAEKLGVKRLAIARWESGIRNPDSKNQKRLLHIAMENGLDTKNVIVSNEVDTKSEIVSNVDTKNENVSNELDTNSETGYKVDTKLDTNLDTNSQVDTKNVSSEQENVSSLDTKLDTKSEVTDENVNRENVNRDENVTDENVTDQNVNRDENVSNDRVEVTSDRPDSREACASDGTAFDPAYITNVLELLHGKSDGIVEVRIFPNDRYLNINGHREWVGKTVSGYYTDVTKIAQDVKPFDGKGNIYFTLNPVNPDLLARAANRLKYSVETTTKDNDIIADRWLPIDIDPIRPKDISSTDKELKLALKKQAEIVTWLDKFSIPTITGMSGNGAHILIPLIGYPNNQETRQAKEQFIHFLKDKFSDDKVNVDETVFNMARIWKLYGTMAVKGDNISERPHRRAWLSIPADITPIDLYAMLPDILPKKESEPEPPKKRERPKTQAPVEGVVNQTHRTQYFRNEILVEGVV